MDTRHPGVTVKLTGTDGNVFAVLGRVQQALERAGVPAVEVSEFMADATSGDYDHALATCMAWVDVT